jgi:succinate dehydrogenase/fumarate reductase flavoprotein subunit
MQDISRRGFLTGAGAAAGLAAAAGMGLTGCAPASSGSKAASSDAALTASAASKQKWSFETAPSMPADSEIKQTYQADVVVVGSGVSGMCCAVSAAESGCDTIVVSAGTKAVGRGGSNQAIGSKYQKQMGIEDSVEARREQTMIEQIAATMFCDKRKWARWENNSGAFMDWMVGKMTAKGLKVSLEPAYVDPDGVLSSPAASHNFWNDSQPLGVFYGAPLIAQAYADTFANDLGGKMYFQHNAYCLVRDDNSKGRVSAVIAKNADGDYVKFEAKKAVVLATGDFSKNEDMMARYCPYVYGKMKDKLMFGTPDYDVEMNYSGLMDGRGQQMGLWVGAAWQKTFPTPCAINGGATGPAHCVVDNFWGINLASDGKRFMNENTNFAYAAYAKLQLPEQTVYAVWDTAYASTQSEWETLGCTVGEVNGIPKSTPDKLITSWDQMVQSGSYVKADTLDALLAKLDGLDVDQAKASIATYNGYAEKGMDEEFHVNPKLLYPIKQGPFYGSKSTGATFLSTMGGLRTDAGMQVCEDDDTPIQGLYNVGSMIGDFYANSYNFGFPGQNLGGACGCFPWLLGRDLAKL